VTVRSWRRANRPVARVFFQDEYNVGAVQRGLHTLVQHKSGVSLRAYQETKIRHFYAVYRDLMGRFLTSNPRFDGSRAATPAMLTPRGAGSGP